ncbi:MAG TPA: PAS domain S-box protein, partial [Gammaproteobacteria bacterium]|nr:PAS domain S-box protein [Gammaproteobacteria bacterium]
MGPNQPLIFDAAVFLLLLLLLAAAGAIAYDGHVWVASGLIAGGLLGAWIYARHEGQRRRIQAELKANQQRLGVIIDASADGLLVLDNSGFVRFANPAALQLLDRPQHKVVGSQLGLPIGDEAATEVDIPRAEQPPGVAIMRARPIRWDDAPASLVLLQDVTDLKARETQARREARIHAMLSACNHLVVRTREIQTLREGFCRQVVESGGYPFAWIGTLDGEPEKGARPVAWAGNGGAYLEAGRGTGGDSEPGQGPVGATVRTGQLTLIEDTETDPRFGAWQDAARCHGYKGVLALPLQGEREIFGVLVIYSAVRGIYDEHEVRLLQELADDLAFGYRDLEVRQAHQEAEAARAEAERQYRLVLQSTGEGIIGVSRDGLITFANRAATDMLGFTPAELQGKSAHMLLHHSRPDGSDYPHEECPMQATLSDGKARRVDDEVLWREDGTALPVDYTSNPIWQEGELLGCVIAFNDITRRRQAEAQRDRLGEIIEATPDLVSYATPDGKVQYLNPGGRRLMGVAADDPLPQRSVFDRRPEWVARVLREEGYPTVRRDDVWHGETAYLDNDDREIPVSQLLVAHRDSEGQINYISSIARDIRDRKQLEAALQAAAMRQESFANSVISTLPGI